MSHKCYYYLFLDGTKIKTSVMTVARLILLEKEHGKLVRKEKV